MKIEEVWPEWSAVGEPIGRGSYGIVYKCVCRECGEERYSAIKVISVPQDEMNYSSLSSEKQESIKVEYKEIIDNFSNEIKILETLKGNKNIVAIEDSKVVEKKNGIGWHIFIRMELLTDLEEYLENNTFEKNDVLRLGVDLCQALKACSEKKIIHRDIKPRNIFVDGNGNFKLGDFGVAKQLEKTTASMSRKGTYEYMSPEVFYQKKDVSKADIYSLAMVMYKLLNNNRLPFLDTEKQMITYGERETAVEKRLNGEKLPIINGIDENINSALLGALEYKREKRLFKNAEEFELALKNCVQGKKLKRSFKKISEKNILTNAFSVILIFIIVCGTLGFILSHRSAKKEFETIIVNEPTIAETTAATGTTKEITSEPSTKKTEKTTITSLNANDDLLRLDEENLVKVLEYFVWFSFFSESNDYSRITLDTKSYDCTSSDAVGFAYNTMFGNYAPFYKEVAYIYDQNSYKYSGFNYAYAQDYNFIETVINDYGNKVNNPDPKKRFNKSYGYEKINAEYIDKYLETVFNVKPNHSLDFKGLSTNVYYYNGYYYCKIEEGGDGSGPKVYIDEIKKSKEGKYVIVASCYEIRPDYNIENDEQIAIEHHMYDLRITADQKIVNDNRVWSFYRIEKKR